VLELALVELALAMALERLEMALDLGLEMALDLALELMLEMALDLALEMVLELSLAHGRCCPNKQLRL